MRDFIAAALSALAGGLGLGGGSVLLLYLTIFQGVSQLTAAGINLLFFLPTGGIALFLHHRHGLIHWRVALFVIIPGTVGAILGSLAAGMLNSELISRIFGGLVLCMGLRELFSRHKKTDPLHNHKFPRAN